MRITRLSVVFISLSFLSLAQSPPEDKSAPIGPSDAGTVCVLPNSADPPTRISPGGEYNPATLKLSIDKQTPIAWPHKQPVRIEHLALSGRHLVVVTSDGKRIKSLWFRFSDFRDPKVCIYFDGYQGVQLGDRHSTYWCRCK